MEKLMKVINSLLINLMRNEQINLDWIDNALNRRDLMDFDSAWTEYKWVEHSNFIGSTLEKSGYGFNIAFKIKSVTTASFIYDLQFISDSIGGIGGYNPLTKQHEGFLYTFPDTLKVLVEEKNPTDTIGWIKPIITDTIIYIKCNN